MSSTYAVNGRWSCAAVPPLRGGLYVWISGSEAVSGRGFRATARKALRKVALAWCLTLSQSAGGGGGGRQLHADRKLAAVCLLLSLCLYLCLSLPLCMSVPVCACLLLVFGFYFVRGH